jgi:hypothetical protein
MDLLEKMDMIINDMGQKAIDNETMDIDDIDLMGPEDLEDNTDAMSYTNGNNDDGERPYKIKPDKVQTKFTAKFQAMLDKAKK